MSKTMVIWNMEKDYNTDTEMGMLINPSEIKEVVMFNDAKIAGIQNISINEIDKLNSALKDNKNKIEIYDEDDVRDFLTMLNYDDNIKIEILEDYPVCKELVCYDFRNNEFFDLNMCDIEQYYEYWNGHNWKPVFCENEIEICYSDDFVDLDEWNGYNFQTNGLGHHEKVHKIISTDFVICNDEYDEDHYMILYESQHCESYDMAEIVNKDALVKHLEDLGRDVEKYINLVDKIEV